VLGVAKEASAADIKKAYRARPPPPGREQGDSRRGEVCEI
jgi:hypothetical protein